MIKLKNLITLHTEGVTESGNECINGIYTGIKKYLKYCAKDAKNVWGSTHLDKGGKPAIRIDSKLKPTGIWVIVRPSKGVDNGLDIVVKTIVNNPQNNLVGMGGILFNIVIEEIRKGMKKYPNGPQYNLVIDHNVNGAFWKKMEGKYPDIPFHYED